MDCVKPAVFEPLPVLPLTQKARGKLHQELQIMFKMGYAMGATAQEKVDRYEEIERLLAEDRAQNPDKYR